MEMVNFLLSLLLDSLKWLFKKFKKPNPVLILKHRKKIKKEFTKNLPPKNKYGVRSKAIIRDINRMDSYPDIKSARKGISPWFKVEIKGLYHKGLEVFISYPRTIKQDEKDNWQFTKTENSGNGIRAFPVGRIAFDSIEHIDWEGDEFYNFPHIYCRFKSFKKQPYESIPFYIKRGVTDYLFEVENFRPWDKKRGIWFLKLKK